MDYRTKSLLLSNYLWIENETPVEITNSTVPQTIKDNIEQETIANLSATHMDSLINSHPSLRIYDFKLKQLSIEEKFKKDKLKPTKLKTNE